MARPVRETQRVLRIRPHRAKTGSAYQLIRAYGRGQSTGSDQLGAFELLRHDRGAAESLRRKRDHPLARR